MLYVVAVRFIKVDYVVTALCLHAGYLFVIVVLDGMVVVVMKWL